MDRVFEQAGKRSQPAAPIPSDAPQASTVRAALESRPARLPDTQGQALDPDVAEELGSRLGADLSRVRVHTDAEAAAAADRLQARAFTVDQDIYFGRGEGDTSTAEGRSLLVHEVTHTLEPVPAGRAPYLRVRDPDGSAERRAEQAASGGRPERPVASASGPAPALHRQPREHPTIVLPTIVLFTESATDVAGARRTAERLAYKIQAGSMTDEDHEVLRQAVQHFTGRALRAFREVIDSAIKDRDVLRELRRQAPPEKQAGTVVAPVLVSPMDPGSRSQAQRAGERHAKQLLTGSVSSDLRDEIYAHLRFFKGTARTRYRAELTKALEEVRARTERHRSGGRRLLETRGNTMGEGFGPTSRFEQVSTEVLPVGQPRTTFGMSVTLIAAIREQRSDSVSVEYYTDYSGGVEASLKIPIKKVVEVKVGGGAKWGRKTAEKEETAHVRSTEQRMARNYQVDVLEREVVRKTFRQVTEETRPVGGGFVLTDVLEDVLTGSDTVAQLGYRLTAKEGGQVRELWPTYVGTGESRTAAQGLADVFEGDGGRLATELARLVSAGF